VRDSKTVFSDISVTGSTHLRIQIRPDVSALIKRKYGSGINRIPLPKHWPSFCREYANNNLVGVARASARRQNIAISFVNRCPFVV